MDDTASALERAFACPPSTFLPQVNESNEDADRGSEIHKFVRNVAAGMPIATALLLVPKEHQAVCQGIDFARVCGDLSNVRAEVSYAIDVERSEVRELGINLGRKYPPRRPAEFAGTNDIEGRRIDDVEVVGDVKTGELVTPCRDNPQMKFHARARQLATGASEVEGRLIYIRRDGKVMLDCHTFRAFELETFQDEAVFFIERREAARARYEATGQVTVSTGDHCKYCPAMTACPRYVALARSMVVDVVELGTDVAARGFVTMTPEQMGIAWAKLTDIGRVHDQIKEGLKAMAKQGSFPLPNGKMVRMIEFARSDFSREKAFELMRAKGATQAEIEACYAENTVQQVREGNGPKILGAAPKRKALKGAA